MFPVSFLLASDFVKQRDLTAWAAACIPLQSPSSWSLNSLNSILTIPFSFTNIPPLLSTNSPPTDASQPLPEPNWNRIPQSSEIITISTQFRPDLPANKKLRFPKDKSDSSNLQRWNYTEEQRKEAKNAAIPKDLEDIQNRVSFSVLLNNYSFTFCFLVNQSSKQRKTLQSQTVAIFGPSYTREVMFFHYSSAL